MNASLLHARNLTHAYGDAPLFEGLDLDVEAGAIVQLTGRNGAGKTTLLHMLAGLKTPHEGRVARAPGATLAYVGHRNALKGELSAHENLALYEPSYEKRSDALEKMGLSCLAGQSPCHRLSAGQQRKVALARLLLSTAAVWLLDEPFTALDDDARARIASLLEAQAARGGAAVVATHDALPAGSAPVRRLALL